MEKFHGSTKTKFLLNQRGQFVIESVLLMVVLVGCFLVITNYTQKNKMLQKMVTDPVAQRFGSIIGFGTWKPDGCTAPGHPKQTLGKCHPNSINRSLSSAPGP
jgi:hypothetical protein